MLRLLVSYQRDSRQCSNSDLAILYSGWTMNGKAPDGSAVSMKGQTSDVVRRLSGVSD